jgi:transposase
MDNERIVATEAATVAATVASSEPRIEIVTERRPAYSAAFRARVLAESSAPGVRAPDLAHRYGIHVSLIYRWRRMAKAQTNAASSARPRRQRRATMEASAVDAVAVPPVTFIPVRVIGHPVKAVPPATGIDGTRMPGTEVSTVSRAASRRLRTAVPRCDRHERPGVIEISMAGGTTLRVDATVDEEALRRVLTVLRGLS